jgi:peptide alpha-N-acetyltransferase
MRMNLEGLKGKWEEDEDVEMKDGEDEGEAVGSEEVEDKRKGDKLRKVKVGRQLGVGDLVERNEAGEAKA